MEIRLKNIEIAEKIYWVGNTAKYSGIRANPYLILDDECAVLIDPGSVPDFEAVLENVTALTPIENIKYVIVHNPNPANCAALPLFEKAGLKAEIVCHWQSTPALQFYGITSEFYHFNLNGFELLLPSGRKLEFIHTPYLNHPGSFITFDTAVRTLFSGYLFCSYALNDNLFADEYYIEQMKGYHESMIPAKEILLPVLEKILWLGINIIAPFHGSIINDDAELYIMELKRIEGGELLRSARKEMLEAGGYTKICNRVVKELSSLFTPQDVLDTFKDTEIILEEETLTVKEFSISASSVWDRIFEIIYVRKGTAWLSAIQPIALELAGEYSLGMPEAFARSISRYEEAIKKINRENVDLKELNEDLLSTMELTLERLTKDPVTKLFNEAFFRDFLHQEVSSSLEGNNDFCIVIISIDQAGQILFTSGPQLLNEIIKQLVFLLQNSISEEEMLFKLDGNDLALFIPKKDLVSSIAIAEKIRNQVSSSGVFTTPVTISAGIISLGEFIESKLPKESLAAFILNTGKKRADIARSSGMNILCASSELSSEAEERNKILLIDSDEMNIELMKNSFEQMGFRVYASDDGDTAIQILETEQPSLVISEIMIPKVDGFLIREKMLQSSALSNIPMIYISNYKDEKNVQRSLSLNVIHYLKKPYMLSELTGIAKNILRAARI